MSTSEEVPFSTSDPAEIRAIINSLYTVGAFDDGDIYEIVRPDGATEQLHIGGALRNIADDIIQRTYPDCVVTLLSAGEPT